MFSELENVFDYKRKSSAKSKGELEKDMGIQIQESVKSKDNLKNGKSNTSSVSTISGFHIKDLFLGMDEGMTYTKAKSKTEKAKNRADLNSEYNVHKRSCSEPLQMTHQLNANQLDANLRNEFKIVSEFGKNFTFVGNEVSMESIDPLIVQQIAKLDKSYDYLIINVKK